MTDVYNSTARRLMSEFLHDILLQSQKDKPGNIPLGLWYSHILRAFGKLLTQGSSFHSIFDLCILGSTSSGKTTLINAFLGRSFLPCDADELSAGAVVFSDGEAIRLLASNLSNHAFMSSVACSSVESVRLRMQALLFALKELKRTQNRSESPIVEIQGDLQFVRNLLGVPANQMLRVVDLPGLRRSDDTDNEASIRAFLPTCYPLFVVDVTQLHLREELTALIHLWKANIDKKHIVVFLNKIDRRNANDSPIVNSVNYVKKFFSETIPSVECSVVAGSAMLFGLATEISNLLHSTFFEANPYEEQALWNRVRNSFVDTSAYVSKNLKSPQDIKRFRALEDAIADEDRVQVIESCRWYAQILFHVSNAQALLDVLRRDTQRSEHPDLNEAASPKSQSALSDKLDVIAALFHAMIAADGQIDDIEMQFATDLLCDYSQLFMGKSLLQQQCQTMLKQVTIRNHSFILRQFFSVVDDAVEREWCIGALQALVAVDRYIHPKEQELLQAVNDGIRRRKNPV